MVKLYEFFVATTFHMQVDEWNDDCLTDGADVLYNKFDVTGSSPPNNPPQRPNSDYSCVVDTTDHWKVSRCTERHLVVCQSDHYIQPGMLTTFLQIMIILSTSYIKLFWHYLSLKWNKKHLKNVRPIRHCEPPHALILHCHSPGVATIARRLRIDVHDNDNNDNAWQRGPLWPHRMGPIKKNKKKNVAGYS